MDWTAMLEEVTLALTATLAERDAAQAMTQILALDARLQAAERLVAEVEEDHRLNHAVAHLSAMQICTPRCQAASAYRAAGRVDCIRVHGTKPCPRAAGGAG